MLSTLSMYVDAEFAALRERSRRLSKKYERLLGSLTGSIEHLYTRMPVSSSEASGKYSVIGSSSDVGGTDSVGIGIY